MNKYQEALKDVSTCKFRDDGKTICNGNCADVDFGWCTKIISLNILQELIDNYNKLEKAYDLACQELAKDNSTRLVLLGGKAEDYKKYFLEK